MQPFVQKTHNGLGKKSRHPVESHYHLKKSVGFCISEILWLGGAGGVEEVGSPSPENPAC